MRKKFGKKLLSLFLAFVMLLTSLSVGITALASEADWTRSVSLNGQPVTEKLRAIASALYNNPDIASINDHYQNLSSYAEAKTLTNTVEGNNSLRGDYLIDNANGAIYTVIENLWDIILETYNAQGSGDRLDNKILTEIASGLQTFMGSDWSSNWAYANPWFFNRYMGVGAASWAGSNSSTSVVVKLDPAYYLWGGPENRPLDSLSEGAIVTHRAYWWKSNDGTANENQYKVSQANRGDYYATVVNAAELKAFGGLFTSIWDDFTSENFDAIDNDTQLKILNEAQKLIQDIQLGAADENGNRNGHEVGFTGSRDGNINLTLNSKNFQADTNRLFDHYFPIPSSVSGDNSYAKFDTLYNDFIDYLLQKFINAVNDINSNYTDGVINSGLSLDDLRGIKESFDNAYGIWEGLPDTLRSDDTAEAAKALLDSLYYNPNDSVNNEVTSFVTAWNTANAQAYIDAVEELEFASGYVSGTKGDDYVIQTKTEADKVKALLDAADAAYESLLWELPYYEGEAKDGAPAFEDITVLGEGLEYVSPQNGYTITDGLSVFDYAVKVHYEALMAYQEYLYRQFMQIAPKNLDEYVVDADNNGITLNDQIVIPTLSILDVVPVRSKVNRVKAAYEPLIEEFRNRPWVQFYMDIVYALEAALNGGSIEHGAWQRYNLDYPYYYNWDEKDKNTTIDNIGGEDQVANLLAGLNALINSKQVADVLGADSFSAFASDTIDGFLTGDMANTIIQAILGMVMPLIQDAMKNAKIDNDTVLVIHATALSAKRNNGKLYDGGLGDLWIEVMYPDPVDLTARISHYTSNQNTIAAANEIGKAGYNWDAVEWENVDWKIETVDEFCNVLGGILECIAKLVNALLFNIKAEATLTGSCAGIAASMADVTISKWWNAGYEKDILPFLELLGCQGLQNASTLTSWAQSNKWADVAKAIVNPLLNRIKSLLTGDVVSNILGILPNLAYLLLWDMIAGTMPTWSDGDVGAANNDGVGVRDLLSPLTGLAGLSLEGFGITALDGSFIMDTINGILADTGIVLPDINWAMIAGMGEKVSASSLRSSGTRQTINAYPKEILVFFIKYIAEVIATNKDVLFDMVSGILPDDNPAISELFEHLFDKLIATAEDDQAFGAVIFELIRAVETVDYDWTSTWEWEQNLVDYTGLPYTEDEVNNAIDNLTAVVANLVNNFLFKDEAGEKLDLKGFLNQNVFTGELVNTLFKTIYSLDSDTIRTIFSFIEIKDSNNFNRNIDMSPGYMAGVLRAAGFDKVATVIQSAEYYIATDDEGNETANVFNYISDEMWGIDSIDDPDLKMEQFRKAIVALFDPFKYNIGTILAGDKTGQGGAKGSTTVGGVLTINGYNGYRNGLKAVMAVFGSGLLPGTTLVSESDFEDDPNGSLNLITKMVFELIDAYCADPLGAIIEIVPQVASFIHNGGLQNSLAQVIQPLWNVFSAIFDLFQINNDIVDAAIKSGGGSGVIPQDFYQNEDGSSNNLINVIIDAVFQEENSEYRDQITWDNIQYHIFDFVNQFLKGIEINGTPYDFEIPSIDWFDLGGSGDRSTDDMKITPDKDSVVVKVLRWVWRIVKTNGTTFEALIKSLGGEDNTVAAIYEAFTAYIDIFGTNDDKKVTDIEEDDFVNIIVKLVNGLDSSGWDSTEIWDNILNAAYETTVVEYPINVDDEDREYTSNEVNALIEFVSNVAVGALNSFLELDLSDVSSSLYTSMLPLLVVKNLYPVFDSAASVLEILDIKFTFEDFMGKLDASYPEIAAAIRSQTYLFEEKNEEGEVITSENRSVDNFAAIDWAALEEDFEDMFEVGGDSAELSKALAFVLDPFIPVLNFLFNAGEFNIMGIVPLKGSYGYRNAILPLFKALGIDAKSAEEYISEAASNPQSVLTNIIDPLLSWLDSALAFGEEGSGPVGAIIGVLPELAALIDNGGIQQFIHDLTYPISNLVDNILLILTKNEDATLFNIVFDFALAMLSGSNAEEEEDEGLLGTVKKALEAIFGAKENEIKWDNVHEHLFDILAMALNIASVDKDGNLTITITINEEDGTQITVRVPDYQKLLKRIAGVDKSDATKKITDSLLIVWQYIWDGILNGRDLEKLAKVEDDTTIESVKALLKNLLGEETYEGTEVAGYPLSRYIENALTSEGNEIVAALIQMMGALDSSDYDADGTKYDFFYGADGILTEPFAGLEALGDMDYPALKDASKEKTDPGYYYDVDDVKELVDALSSIIKTAIMIISGTQDADNISISLLFNDEMMGKLAGLIAPLADNSIVQTVLPLLGVDFSKDALVEKLEYYGYTELAAAVAAAESLSDFDWEANAALWYVSDQTAFLAKVYNSGKEGAQLPDAGVSAETDILGHYRFAKALAVLLSPFSGLLNALLNSGTIEIAGMEDLTFTGAPSYGLAIKPLLDAMGCDTAELEDYQNKTDGNTDYVLFYLLDPLLAKVDQIVKDPANTLLSMLPKLAAFFDNGGLEQAIMNLLHPVAQLVNPLFRLVLDDKMDIVDDADSITIYDLALALTGVDGVKFEDLHDNIFNIVAKLLAEDKEGDGNSLYAELIKGDLVLHIPISGNMFDLTIPQYDLDRIAGCGLADTDNKKITDAFVVVFRYIEKILKVNSESIVSLVEGLEGVDLPEVVITYIKNVVDPPTAEAQYEENVNDSLLITLIRVVQHLKTGDLETNDRWLEIGSLPEGEATFTDGEGEYYGETNLGLAQFTSAITTLSNAVSAALQVFADLDLANLTEDKIYSNDIVSKLASIIFPLADNNTVDTILGMLGIDLGKENLIELFTKYGYTEIAALLGEEAAIDWESEEVKALWYVTDAAGFETNVWNNAQLKSESYTIDTINAKYRFTRALVAVLAPFADLIGVLLLPDKSINIADGTIEIDGAFGYKNAIKPLLEALRADPVDSETYVEMAEKDSVYILFNIIDPLLTKVDAILTDPVNELLSTIPRLANYLKDGGLQLTVENLLYPLTAPLDPIVRLIMGDIQGEDEVKPGDIYDIVIDYFAPEYADLFSWADAQDHIFEIAESVVNKLLSDKEDENSINAVLNEDGSLTLNNLFGLDGENGEKTYFSFTIPAINGEDGLLTRLAVCGNPLDLSEYGEEEMTGDKTPEAAAANSFIVLVEWIWEVVAGNEETIREIIVQLAGQDNYDKFIDYIDHLFNNKNETVVAAVVNLLNALDASNYDTKNVWAALLAQSVDATIVEYPEEGYDAEDIDRTVATISEILVNVLTEFAEIDITGLTGEYIYNDSIITALAKIVLSLSDVEIVNDIFTFIDVDFSKDYIAGLLQGVSASAAEAIKAAPTAADIDWDAVTWGISDSASFINALVAVLSPLNPVLSYLLLAGTIDINSVVVLTGANGYDNAVKQLLEGAFGITGLKDGDDYKTFAEDGKTVTAVDMSALLKDVLTAVLGKVDDLLKSDNIIGSIADMIPQLALFINNGGVQQFVADLIYPLTNFINPIISLISDKELFNLAFEILDKLEIVTIDVSWRDIHNELLELAQELVLDDLTIKIGDYELKLKLNTDITWAGLAGCAVTPEGKDPEKTETEIRSDTIVYILYYIWDTVQDNKNGDNGILGLVKSLLGDTYDDLGTYIETALGKDEMDVVQAIVDIFDALDSSEHEADWSFLTDGFAHEAPDYTELGIKREDVANLIDTLSDIVEAVIGEFIGEDGLNGFVAEKLYTGSLLETVNDAINGLVEDETISKILDIVGITLEKHEKEYAESYERDAFVAELAEILRPFEPLLVNVFVASDEFDLAKVLTVTGANGGENAIAPFINYALGGNVDGSTLTSIEAVLNALLGRVEEILNAPVEEVLALIPTLANFIDKGGIQYFVEELLYPILHVAEPILGLVTEDEDPDAMDVIFDIANSYLDLNDKLGLDEKVELTWDNITDKLVDIANGFLEGITINDTAYSFTLKSLDLKALAKCGIKTEGNYKLGGVDANPDTFVTLFEIIWNIVQDNEDSIRDILDGVLGDLDSNVKAIVDEYIDNLFKHETGDVIKAIVDLFNALDTSEHEADWSFLTEDFTQTSPEYGTADGQLGVTESEVAGLLDTLSAIANDAIGEFLTDGEALKDFLAGKIYTGEMVGKIQEAVNGIYNNDTVKSVFSILGLDEPAAVETDYTGVSTKEGFIEALVAILAPLDDIVAALLNGEELTVANAVTIKAANGFNNAIKPLLEYAFGATTTDATISGLLTAVLDRVDAIADAPVDEVLELIAPLMNFITKGGIQYFVEELLYPVLAIAAPILSLIQDPADEEDINVFDLALELLPVFVEDFDLTEILGKEADTSWKGITSAENLKKIIGKFIGDFEIEINDTKFTFTVDSLDLAKLAGCGVASTTADDYSIAGDREDTFVTIFEIIWAIVDENRETINSILDNVLSEDLKEYVGDYIQNILDKDCGDILRALVDLFDGFDSSGHEADWSILHDGFEAEAVTYDKVAKTDVEYLIEQLGTLVDNALAKYLLDEGTELVDFLAEKLYTRDTIIAIRDIINDLAANETVTTILDLLGIELTVNENEYNDVADKTTFISALVDILKPFKNVVDAFLVEGEIKVAGVLTITGSNGFDNALKPLLEYALGATVDDGTTKDLEGLLTALLDRVDEILDQPIDEVLELIPTLANFIDKGGVQNFIYELLYPIINMLSPILELVKDEETKDLGFFDFVLDVAQGFVDIKGTLHLPETTDITWDGLFDLIPQIADGFLADITINGETYTFTVSDSLTLEKLAECGTKAADTYAITGDAADTFVTIFDLIWSIVDENRDEIDRLITNVLGDGKAMDIAGEYISNVLDSDYEDVLKALIEVFKGLTDSNKNVADWSFLIKDYTKEAIVYDDYEFEKADVEGLIEALSTVANNAISAYVLTDDIANLGEFLASKLYTADTVNAIIGVLNGLDGNDTVKMILGLLGIELELPIAEVSNIATKEDFIAAIVDVLSPFETVVNAFLQSGTINIAGVLDITGHNGFENALKPMLEYALGATVTEDATLEGLLTALLGRVDDILASDDLVGEVLGMIPTLANFIDKGGIQYFVEQLLYPVIHILNPIIGLIQGGDTKYSFFDFVITLVDDILTAVNEEEFSLADKLGVDSLTWMGITDQLSVVANHFLEGLTIDGNEYSFTVNALDLALLASRSTGFVNNYGLEGDRPDTFVTIFSIIWGIVTENRENINSLIDNLLGKADEGEKEDKLTSTLKEYIGNVLDKNEGDVIEALIEVFKGFDASALTANWNFLTQEDKDHGTKEFKHVAPDYSPVTEEEVEALLDKLSDIAEAAIAEFILKEDYASLGDLLADKLYTQDIVDTVNDLVYDTLATNGTVTMILGLLGVELKSENKATYTINEATAKADFIDALASILAPFQPIVDALLNKGTLNIAEVLEITGANGLVNAINPLLQYALGADAAANADIKTLLEAVLNRVDEIADAPLDEVLKMIPSLVNFIDKGGIQYFVEQLLAPVIGMVDPIIKLVQPKGKEVISVFDFALNLVAVLAEDLDLAGTLGVDKVEWDTIHKQIPAIVNHFLEGLTISENEYTFTVNSLVFSDIAQGGGDNASDALIIDGDREDTFVTIFGIIWAIVDENREEIDKLLGNVLSEDIMNIASEYIGNVLDKNSGDVLEALVDVFAAFDGVTDKADWSFLTDGYANVDYDYESEFGVTKEDVEGLISTLSTIANNALGELLEIEDLAAFVGEKLYTQDLIDTIQGAINDLAGNETVGTILDIIGVELTENTKTYTIDGKDSFIEALAEILDPFTPVINALLNGDSITIMNVLTINGSDAFNNAINPLIEYALGGEAAASGSLADILTAVLGRVDEILADPVNEVLELIPILVNFINEGGIQYFVEQLLAPVLAIAEPIVKLVQEKGKEKEIFDFAIDALAKADVVDVADMIGVDKVEWDNIHEQIPEIVNGFVSDLKIKIGDGEYTFTLKSLDFDKLAKCGELNTPDNFVVNGDAADTFVTLFDIIWDIVKENEDTIKEILENALPENIMDVVGDYIDNLFDNKSGDIIKALVEVFKGLDASGFVADWSFLTEDHSYKAAKYPSGVTASDVDELIQTIASIAENAISEFILKGEFENLAAYVGDMLYTQELVDTVQGVINDLAGNETVAMILGLLGVDLAENTTTYTVDGKDSFIAALADILAPFAPIVDAFLSEGELTIAGVLPITGSNGLANAINPLLEYALGGAPAADATLADILDALLTRVEEIVNDPVNEVLGLIPMLTNFINEGGIQKFLEYLLHPVFGIVEPILALITDDSLVDFALSFLDLEDMLGVKGITWDNIQTKIPEIINGFLEGIEINGGEYTFTVKSLDFAALAACGNANGTLIIEGSDPDTFVTIFGIIWDIVQENKKEIGKLLDSLDLDDTIRDMIDNVLDKDSKDIVKALVEVFKGLDASGHTADWSFLTNGYKSKSPKYPNGITSSDVDEMLSSLSTILENALAEFILDGDSLADFVSDKLYTGDLVKTVQNLINSLAENETVTTILDLLDVELKANNKSYKVTDKKSFINALSDILAPFDSLVEAFLSEGDIKIAGVVTLTSSDVFENAIKPLLEYALGCTNVTDASIKGILTAVLDRVDEILDNPIDEILGLIPMLTNFINKGGIQKFVEELLYPILNMADPILALISDEDSLFDFIFDLIDLEEILGVKKVTWDNIHTKIPEIINGFLKDLEINGGKYTFTVNKLDFAALAACGKASGLNVIGNNADTFVTLFGIIWDIVKENRKAIDKLLDSLLSDNIKDIAGDYIDNVLDKKSTDIVKAMVKVFKGFNASAHKADWSFLFKNYKQTNVKYPSGVTSADIEEVIDILTVAIENALDIFLDTSLPELVGGIVYTDSIINSVKDLINTLAKNDTVKSVLDLFGMELKANNKTYKVTDKASFAAALADVLAPFEPLLNAFLNKGTINIAGVVTITGADGFNNAVKPLLEYALGCTNVKDSSLKGIITAVLNRVEEIVADPVEELVDLLPMLSNFIGKGGVQYFVEELLYPVINIADAVLELITDENLFDFAFNLLGVDLDWSNAQNEIVPLLNSMLKNVKINGKSYSITIPSITWSKLGGCGTLKGTSINAKQGDTVMTLLEYIFKALEANQNIIFDLVGDNATIKQIINNVLDQGAGGMARIVVRILLKMETFDNVTWTFKNIKHVDTTYTENLTEENYAEIVEQIDDILLGMIGELASMDIGGLLKDMVYKNSIVNTVAKLVYTNLEKINLGGISIHQIMEALDLDITTSGVAAMLKDYSSASSEIGKHASWSEVNFDAITWNFSDGDKTGFINGLSAALRPIQPLIRVLLSGEDLIVLGSIHIKGGDGYNTVVIPLLEAIGVEPEALVSPQQYAADASTDKVLTSVLTPLLDFAETLLNKPILTLCNMLPNVAYFLLNGGAQAIVENLAGPVFNLLEEIAPIYDLDVDKLLKDAIGFGISDLGNLDLDELVNTLLASIKINGEPLPIRITDIDLETLAGRGELVEYTSARTYYGVRMECKKIEADAPAVFISVLRYIVENLKANLDAIVELLAGLGLSGSIADTIQQILDMLTSFDVDGVIEALLGILFDFGDGEITDGDDSIAPYEVGNYDWQHIAIYGGAALFMLLFFIILAKKKKKEEEEEVTENAGGAAQE